MKKEIIIITIVYTIVILLRGYWISFKPSHRINGTVVFFDNKIINKTTVENGGRLYYKNSTDRNVSIRPTKTNVFIVIDGQKLDFDLFKNKEVYYLDEANNIILLGKQADYSDENFKAYYKKLITK